MSEWTGHVTCRPHPGLRGLVRSITGYRDRPDPRAVHHGLPSPDLTVILAFDEPIDVGWLATAADHSTYWSMTSGLHVAPALIRPHGFQHGIQLALTPLGCRRLLGVPAGEMASNLVDLADLPTALGPDLRQQLAEAAGWDTRLALLETALLERARPAEIAPELGEAWRLLRCGDRGVAEIADVLGWSRRWLHRRFSTEFGLSPQQVGRLFRFDRAKSLAENGAPLADVAARVGYADQAHLTRDWVALAGATPTSTLREPYPVAA